LILISVIVVFYLQLVDVEVGYHSIIHEMR
jgi:hypothetical protein